MLSDEKMVVSKKYLSLDQLKGAACSQKLVEALFRAVFNLFVNFKRFSVNITIWKHTQKIKIGPLKLFW